MTAEKKPEPSFVEVPCPLCGADDPRVIHREDTRYSEAPVSMTIVQCLGCGMVYTNPRLADVNLAYEERSRIDDKALRRYEAVKRPVFRKALERIRRLKPPPARLLDVGCGAGSFLAMAREAGYEVRGVEASAVDAARANERLGDMVSHGYFESAQIEPESLDVITAWDVIEHVPDARAMVGQVCKVLRPGGLLAMRMPGALFHRLKALVSRLNGRHRTVYSPTIHLNFFSRTTIRRLLESEGFAVINIRATTAEGHSSKRLGRAARLGWGYAAGLLHVLTGACLDNLEVYALR